MNNLQDFQSDMRKGYGNGSIGIFVSGIIWIISSLIVNSYSPTKGIWALIIGGMFIFPLGTLIGKLMGVSGQHNKNNPLGKLAMEGTLWMIVCIPLAYGLSLVKVEWFFQGMLMIIGGRYLTFASIYGIRIYWLLGAVLILAAYALFTMHADVFASAFTGGLIETIFGIMMFVLFKYNKISTEKTTL